MRARPRRQASGRVRAGKGGIRWDRVARVCLVAVLAAIVVSYIGPTTDYFRAWKLSGETRAEVQSLQSDNARLRQRVKHLRDPEAVELEARKGGMARPGERVYVIRGLPPD